jgi:hypothetical protein
MSRTTQKAKCKAYASGNNEARNKARNVARAARRIAAAERRIKRRIMAGKAVPSKQAAKFSHRSKGTCIMLGEDITFGGCDSYADRHRLNATSERVAKRKFVDSDGIEQTVYAYKLVNVTRRAA